MLSLSRSCEPLTSNILARSVVEVAMAFPTPVKAKGGIRLVNKELVIGFSGSQPRIEVTHPQQ